LTVFNTHGEREGSKRGVASESKEEERKKRKKAAWLPFGSAKEENSLAGNRTRVAAVTRQNTSLYTTKDA
jgi:hypothetical protein